MNFCTYFDGNYAPQGLVLLRSIARHVPAATVRVLALDDEALQCVLAADWPMPVHVVRLVELEDEALLRLKAQRSWREYIFTLTPTWVKYCLARWRPLDIAYIDADCWLVADLQPLYAELGQSSVAVIPHRWSPQHAQRLRPSGEFNVGWLYFRNDPLSKVVLALWQDDCYGWRKPTRGPAFSDQVYLNSWPGLLGPLLHQVRHLGANLAPWSQEQYTYGVRDGQLRIGGEHGAPVLFYHFHGWRSPANRAGYVLASAVVEHLYLPYEQEVLGASAQGGSNGRAQVVDDHSRGLVPVLRSHSDPQPTL